MPGIFSRFFLIAFIAYLVFATIEEFVPGFVSDYFSVHFLLIPVAVFLILTLYKEKHEQKSAVKAPRRDLALISIASFATLAILWMGANELPILWRVLVALFGGILAAGILTVLFKE